MVAPIGTSGASWSPQRRHAPSGALAGPIVSLTPDDLTCPDTHTCIATAWEQVPGFTPLVWRSEDDGTTWLKLTLPDNVKTRTRLMRKTPPTAGCQRPSPRVP